MKKRKVKTGKKFVALAIIAALSFMGVSYATWINENTVYAKLSTDKFDFKLRGTGYLAEIVDSDGNSADLSDFTVNEIDDEKNAELVFGSGIPEELLEKGNYIRITFPVENTEPDDKTKLYEYDADFSKEEEIVAHASGGYVSFGGSVYDYPNLPEEFMQDIVFSVYRSMERKDGIYYGNVYLELTDASRDAIAALPKEITLDTAPEELFLSDKQSEYDGVLVDYNARISFFLEQFNKKAVK